MKNNKSKSDAIILMLTDSLKHISDKNINDALKEFEKNPGTAAAPGFKYQTYISVRGINGNRMEAFRLIFFDRIFDIIGYGRIEFRHDADMIGNSGTFLTL